MSAEELAVVKKSSITREGRDNREDNGRRQQNLKKISQWKRQWMKMAEEEKEDEMT